RLARQARKSRTKRQARGVSYQRRKDYLCGARNCASGTVAAGGECDHLASVIRATTDLLLPLRAPDLPKSAVVESARTCRCEQALRMATAANYNSKPLQIHRHQRS